MKKYLILLILSSYFLQSCKHEVEIPLLESDFAEIQGRNSHSEKIASIDRLNLANEWVETGFGLWKSKNGDLAIKAEDLSNGEQSIPRFIIDLWIGEEQKPMKEIIDTLSFRYLGSSFYKDKKQVYTHYRMMDGGNFKVVEDADPETFRVIGDCYAKDKNYIYGERAMQLKHIDYTTFKTEKGLGCHAKDKFGYYFWDERIKLDHPETAEEVQLYERLKAL